VTDSEVVRDFLNSLSTRSPHTRRSYERTIKAFIAATDKPIGELTAADARCFVAALTDSVGQRTGKPLTPATIAQHVSAVRAFLRFAQGEDLIPRSPLDGLRRPRVANSSHNRYLDKDEAQRLLTAARETSPQAYAVAAVLLLTGIRVAELIAAQWKDVYRDTSGRLGLRVVGKGTKERVIALRDDLWALLQADRRRRGLSPELSTRDRSPLVTGGFRKGQKRNPSGEPFTQTGVRKLLRGVAERAGIDKPISAHWLRHSFATLAAHNGVTVYDLMQAMGHAKMETSQGYINAVRGLEHSASHLVGISLPSGEQIDKGEQWGDGATRPSRHGATE
jgi:integrase/recombinase XerD